MSIWLLGLYLCYSGMMASQTASPSQKVVNSDRDREWVPISGHVAFWAITTNLMIRLVGLYVVYSDRRHQQTRASIDHTKLNCKIPYPKKRIKKEKERYFKKNKGNRPNPLAIKTGLRI